VRFVPKSNPAKILIGEPVDPKLDIGLAVYQGKDVSVRPFSGSSILNPGQVTGTTEIIARLLSPLAQAEVGSIRCIGLNVSANYSMNQLLEFIHKLIVLKQRKVFLACQRDVSPHP